ncbi:MAG: glutathione peroxidase [Thermonema sp.]|uniref:glutathione peroxidase n=1 Tax=Thermonema sp. TaxID=2231181 RepID=UPI0021DC9444|nr:glutathione peroxidase [Thermonema sp.]GIV38474.1 MAG: glutathione peroxidase [Thermonema sp.]
MGKILSLLLVFLAACWGATTIKSKPQEAMTQAKSSFYDLEATTIDGKPFKFSQLKGKKVLIVNTASKCGYTPQYEDLQAFHEKYGDKVVVLGFPCNQFGGQEPGNEEEIAAFCQKNYGVTFQMFSKVNVKKGEGQHPVYYWLTHKEENGWNDQEPTWNFCKYLINENGELVKFFGSAVNPMDEEVLAAIGE